MREDRERLGEALMRRQVMGSPGAAARTEAARLARKGERSLSAAARTTQANEAGLCDAAPEKPREGVLHERG
jgi:hypothetical protein